MIERLKKAIDSYWVRSKAFRILIITVFFLFMAVPIFLLTVYARIHLGISFSIARALNRNSDLGSAR